MTRSPSERGNALFYILIAIALIAALTIAIASSLRGNAGISTERTSIVAADIIASGNRVAEAVSRMRLREVEKGKICFGSTSDATYGSPTHPDCTDAQGRVFDYGGGGLSWETPPEGAGENQPWGYSGNVAIEELGTAEAELIAFLPYLTVGVCQKINSLIGLTKITDAPPVVGAFTGVDKFVGTFSATTTISTALMKGKKAGCVQAPSAAGTAINPNGLVTPNAYFYFHVLMTN
jgi:hypothetical protein